jgi:hypothetical protein
MRRCAAAILRQGSDKFNLQVGAALLSIEQALDWLKIFETTISARATRLL